MHHRRTDVKSVMRVYQWGFKAAIICCVSAHLGMSVAKFRMGYFRGGLLRHVDLAGHKECGRLK